MHIVVWHLQMEDWNERYWVMTIWQCLFNSVHHTAVYHTNLTSMLLMLLPQRFVLTNALSFMGSRMAPVLTRQISCLSVLRQLSRGSFFLCCLFSWFYYLLLSCVLLCTAYWSQVFTARHLADDLSFTSADGNHRHLRSADSPTLVVRPTRRSAIVCFPWQLHVLGTVSHQPSGMRHHFCRSGAAWRHGFLNWLSNTNFTQLHFVSCHCFYH